MNIDTLMISLSRPEIEKFNFEKAYKHWESKKSEAGSCEN